MTGQVQATQTQPDGKLSRPWLALIWIVLLATAAEFAWLGSVDVNSALTFAGRLDGALLILLVAVQMSAFMALADHKKSVQHRTYKYAGLVVAVAVFLSFIVNLGLLVLQAESLSLTWFILIWSILTVLSFLVLCRLYRQHKEGALKTPEFKTFAAGAIATTLIAVASFTYTQIYQPYTTPAMLTTTVEMGKSSIKSEVVTVPIRLKTKNEGKVGVYVLGSLYQVTARKPIYSSIARSGHDWLSDINHGQPSLFRYENEESQVYQLLAQGRFVGQGRKLDPGSEITTDVIVQFPEKSKYEALDATSDVVFLRADRALLTSDEYAQSGRSSWHKDKTHAEKEEAPGWVAEKGVEVFRYKSRVIHSNAILEYTRSSRYVTVWWVLEEPKKMWNGPYLVAVISPDREERRKPEVGLLQQLSDEYGLDHSLSGRIQKTMQQLAN
ncbi:hypothetical protein ACFVT6_35375 [Streptomyces sp. NPDC058049]|uniref:hypothetical protein n=1 Tax=Streptomyces sp. NPDC058049 TaxID=3346314 RepID=UPI0036E260E9